MKVLFLCKDLIPANVNKQPWAHIYHLMLKFEELGIRTHLISHGSTPDEELEECSKMTEIIPGRMRINVEECVRKVRHLSPDVLNWHSGLVSCLDIGKVASRIDCPIVWNITQRRISRQEFAGLRLRDACNIRKLGLIYSYSLLPAHFVRKAAEKVSAIVVPSTRAKASLISMGIPSTRIHRIPSGIDKSLFSTTLSKNEILAVRERYELPSDHFLLCYFGPLSALRGLDTAVQAFSIMRRSVSRSTLLILARDERNRMAEPSEGFGVKLVSTKLRAADLVRILTACDIIVLPFRLWPFNECPLTILEGMAAGKVVVTTRVGFADDLIVDGINGFLVRPGDSLGLANLLKKLAEDEKTRARVGGAAKQTVLSNYDWGSIARSTLSLFELVVA